MQNNENRHQTGDYCRRLGLRLDVWRSCGVHASGDAPWCAVMQIGEGDGTWDCQYQTVEECMPHVIAGNRGNCSPNPYGPSPAAAASVPSQGVTNTMSSTAANRKFQEHAYNENHDQNYDYRRRPGGGSSALLQVINLRMGDV
jgi:hypothetical protein